jgi:hypothetical protein
MASLFFGINLFPLNISKIQDFTCYFYVTARTVDNSTFEVCNSPSTVLRRTVGNATFEIQPGEVHSHNGPKNRPC